MGTDNQAAKENRLGSSGCLFPDSDFPLSVCILGFDGLATS